MTANFFKNKIVVVTGADSVLGTALTKELLLQKSDVVMVGTKKDELLKNIKEFENLNKKIGRAFAVTGDFSTKEGCENIMREIKRVASTFEILINNNSIFSAGKLEDAKADDIKKIIDINILGNILITKSAIPTLISNKKPGIINICSFEGKIGLPYFSLYSATQFAINGFTESLQREYSSEQLRIMGVCVAGIINDGKAAITSKLEKIGFVFEDPDEEAKKILEAFSGNRKELVLGKKERSLVFWNSISRKSIDLKIKKIKSRLLSVISGMDKNIS